MSAAPEVDTLTTRPSELLMVIDATTLQRLASKTAKMQNINQRILIKTVTSAQLFYN